MKFHFFAFKDGIGISFGFLPVLLMLSVPSALTEVMVASPAPLSALLQQKKKIKMKGTLLSKGEDGKHSQTFCL